LVGGPTIAEHAGTEAKKRGWRGTAPPPAKAEGGTVRKGTMMD
jgi:hypothetical protein